MDDKNFKYFPRDNPNSEIYLNKYKKNPNDVHQRITKTEPHHHLNEKLNDAYSDLEKLKRAVDEMKTNRGNIQTQTNFDRVMTRLVNDNEEILKKTQLYNSRPEMRIRHHQTESAHEIRSPNEENFISMTNYNNFKTPNRNEASIQPKSNTPMIIKNKKKAGDIINNFKEILKESEKFINEQPPVINYPNTNEKKFSHTSNNIFYNGNYEYNHQHDMNSSNIKFSNQNYPQENENNFNSFVNKITSNNLKEEIERLRISNQVLNKSNLDLKNQNKILQYEIEVLQNSNINNFSSGSNYDQNMNNFIEGLKNSLNSCQMSNKELSDIIDNLQKKFSDQTNENNLLKEQSVIMKNEIETLKKKFCELKLFNENLQTEKTRLENEYNQLELKLKEKEEKGNEDEEKISNLFLLIENYEKNKNDNLDVLDNLKNTLEVLKKTNSEIEKEKLNLANKIEEMQNEILQKNYEVDQLKNSVQTESKEKDFTNKEIKNLKEDITAKENYMREIQSKLRMALIEIEKNKTKMETIYLNIEEKDHVITNLKSSLNYYTKTFEQTENELENLKIKIESEVNEKIKILQNFEMCRKKLNDLQNSTNELKTTKEELQMKNLKLEKELIEKRNKIGQMEFDVEILTEKLSEKDSIINKYKEETKVNKLNKISEDISSNYVRGTASKTNKYNNHEDLIEDMSSQLKLKDQVINELLAQIEEINTKKENGSICVNQQDDHMALMMDENENEIENESLREKEEYKYNLPLNNINNNSGSDLFLPMHTINTPRLNELGTLALTYRGVTTNNNNMITHIYSVYNSRTVAAFDLIKNKFEIIELNNSNEFEAHFNNDSVTTLNTPVGFFVLTGINSNLLFYFDNEEKSMKLFNKLGFNHKSGGLAYYNKNNSLYCVSGNHLQSCEKLTLTENKLELFAELIYDRSNAAYVIMNETYLYSFFGYSYLNATYLDTIERVNLSVSDSSWELVNYSCDTNSGISTSLKSFVCMKKNEQELLIIGGYDGKNRTNNKNLIKFSSDSSSIQSLPEIKSLFKLCLYDCTKENKTVSYLNSKLDSFSAVFDDYFQLHLINTNSLEHQIFDNGDKNI